MFSSPLLAIVSTAMLCTNNSWYLSKIALFYSRWYAQQKILCLDIVSTRWQSPLQLVAPTGYTLCVLCIFLRVLAGDCLIFSFGIHACDVKKERLTLLFISLPKSSKFNETRFKDQLSLNSRKDIHKNKMYSILQ